MAEELTVLAVAVEFTYPTWLISEGDPLMVRVVESSYAGDGIYVTAPLHLDGTLNRGNWAMAGAIVEISLPRFAERLQGGMWMPDAERVYHPRESPSDEPEAVAEPDICGCGRVSGPPFRWVLAPVCDLCSNYCMF
ncbi:MAG: hypothetical protein QOG69_1060 [Actinomycetota bacterium]|jgi:hypothetical protein|nr:hypothetical protein [Actinomycetota bacterium]